MTDLPSQLPAGNGFLESGGPRPYRSQCRRPEPSAGQSACSPRCDCTVSFQRPRRLAVCSVPLDLAVGLVWVKTADRTSASSAFCEIAAESRASRPRPTAKHVPDASAGVHKPAMMRSGVRRLGARFRPRFRISTWCRNNTDSTITERSPAGRPSRTMITMACSKRMKMSRMLKMVSDRRSSRFRALAEFATHSPVTVPSVPTCCV